MIFEFGGAPELNSPREAVWLHLQDGEMMAACTPGTQSFELRGPGRYSVTCGVGAGLVRVHVVLEAELHDLVHPESLRLRATGTGPGSTLDVETLVRLEAITPERTRLTWNSVTGVHGMLAKFGRGMVEDTLREFTEKFWTNVADRVAAEAGRLEVPQLLAWIGRHELHQADAAGILAEAVAGPGVTPAPAQEGRVDLHARHRGVLVLSTEGIDRVNAVDPLELSTRWNHQPVEAGELVGSVKTAPHVVAKEAVLEGVRLAGEHRPLLDVRPYVGTKVAALIAEPLGADAAARFEEAARLRTNSLGGDFLGVVNVSRSDPLEAIAAAREGLESLAVRDGAGLLLIGGVSAGDLLAPLFAALERLGGSVVRRGIPAHPGSMLWLGRLGGTQLLGLPRCGAFDMATAADLLLPRLMTGEQMTAESVAPLGYGGLLGREMRSRFPAYARDLPEPPAS